MNEVQKPKIEFPCPSYPIKVMGDAEPQFQEFVLAVMERHDATFDRGSVQVQESRNGRFISVRVSVTATGTEQLEAIFQDLKTNPLVRMVL